MGIFSLLFVWALRPKTSMQYCKSFFSVADFLFGARLLEGDPDDSRTGVGLVGYMIVGE